MVLHKEDPDPFGKFTENLYYDFLGKVFSMIRENFFWIPHQFFSVKFPWRDRKKGVSL